MKKFTGKWHFLYIRKLFVLELKAEKQLRNKNHTEDWVLGSHPGDNRNVLSLKSL